MRLSAQYTATVPTADSNAVENMFKSVKLNRVEVR
jgi:hypothetical protein